MEITNSIFKKSPAVGPGRPGLFLFGPGFFGPGPARAGLSKTARAARVPTLNFKIRKIQPKLSSETTFLARSDD
jgi:hypothetical protein